LKDQRQASLIQENKWRDEQRDVDQMRDCSIKQEQNDMKINVHEILVRRACDKRVHLMCYGHIRALRHVRVLLPDDVARTVACKIIGSRLDY